MTIAMQQPAAGHEANGRFAKGNPGGPGNPNVRRIALMRAAVTEAVTVEEIGAVMQKLVTLALEGDREAAKLVLHYTVGKPADFQADRQSELQKEAFASMAMQHHAEAERPAPARPAAPSVIPSIAPTAAERLLERRGEREKSVEAMLGIGPLPPIANGGNGGAALPKNFAGSRGSGAAEASRSTVS